MPPQPRSPSESVSERSLSSGEAPRPPRPFAPPAMRSVKSHSFQRVAGSSASKSSSTSPLSAASSSGCASRMILMMSARGRSAEHLCQIPRIGVCTPVCKG